MIEMHNTTANNNGTPPAVDSYVTPLVISAVGILFTILLFSTFVFIFWCHYLRPHQSPHGTTNTNTINHAKNSKGVPKEILNKIRIITYSSPQPQESEDSGDSVQSECSICLGQFQDEEKLRVLPNCEHSFHVPCIDAWFDEHTNCPICRSPMDSVCCESTTTLPTDSSENNMQQRVSHVIPIGNDQTMENEFQQVHPVLDRHSHSDSCRHHVKKKPRSLGMRLKRSLSMDQSSLYVSVTIQRDQEEASTSSSSSSSSSSPPSTSKNRYKSKSLKHHMSMVLMRSFSQCTHFSGILPN